eukprot:1157437-Pelagomonas_calceolata.AAC.15
MKTSGRMLMTAAARAICATLVSKTTAGLYCRGAMLSSRRNAIASELAPVPWRPQNVSHLIQDCRVEIAAWNILPLSGSGRSTAGYQYCFRFHMHTYPLLQEHLLAAIQLERSCSNPTETGMEDDAQCKANVSQAALTEQADQIQVI